MSKFSIAMKRVGGFMRRNAFYLLLILCIASIATVIALAVTHNSGSQDAPTVDNIEPGGGDISVQKPDDSQNQDPNEGNKPDVQPDVPKKLTFYMPCNGTVSLNCSIDALVKNETMGDFRTHNGVDFKSDDLNVTAAADGTVEETGYNKLDGYYIVLKHDDGYVTKYMSLEAESTLKKGDKVQQGQEIGKMSTSQGYESLEGAHLHFEMLKDGEYIDPLTVLVLDEK